MGYFDGLTNAWFKKSENGKTIFYPYGKFSSTGFVLLIDDEIKIKFFLKRYYMIFLPIIILSVILFGLWTFILLLILIPFYSFRMERMLSNSEKTQEKIESREVIKNMAIAMGIPMSIFMLVGSLLMTSAAVFCIFIPRATIISVFGILFFGSCLLLSIFLVRCSIKNRLKK